MNKLFDTLGFTSAPWRAENSCVVDGDDHIIAACISGHIHRKDSLEDYATAKLISAAPYMLDVLVQLLESSYYWGEYDVPIGIVADIREAIEQATGMPWEKVQEITE